MLPVKTNPTGIDIPIQKFQKFLYNKLKALWPVDDTNFNGYGRVYRNANDIGYVPELFESSVDADNTVYKQAFFDKTTMKAMFFFSAGEIGQFREGSETVKVSVIFITNLSFIKPALAHRGDEEVRNDVQKLCNLNLYQFVLTGSETGFKNVFSQFSGLTNKDGEVFEDRHPLYCFKLNFELYYQPTMINC